MKIITTKLVLLLFIISSISFAQRNFDPANRGGKITGKVFDQNSGKVIEYANLVLLNSSDTSQANGTVTNAEGIFLMTGIKPGKYFVKASFMGFESSFVNDISIKPGGETLDIGEIKLKPAIMELETAEVVGQKAPIEYHIDKKVINVSEQSTAISGTAVDVLENVPSVSVDVEGNVSLRGSGSFTLLIDGRPTILDANDALQQIPASAIQNIEIVTNPSAKYDPEGVSGIINVITKKNELIGMSGVINGNLGFDNRYGGDAVFNYRINGHSFNFGADYNKRAHPGTSIEERKTFTDDLTSFQNSSGENKRNRTGYSVTAGADLMLSDFDYLAFSGRYGDREMGGSSSIFIDQYTIPESERTIFLSKNENERGGYYYSGNLNYKHMFNKEGHELLGEIVFQKNQSEEFSINKYTNLLGEINSGRKMTEDGPSDRLRMKLDYVFPLNPTDKFEAGFQSEIQNSEDDIKSYLYDSLATDFIYQDNYSYVVSYKDNIHAGYGIYSGKLDNFGYQFGLRTEYTDRNVALLDSSSSSEIKKWDYFPTVHTSYEFSKLNQIMASYTRRIQR